MKFTIINTFTFGVLLGSCTGHVIRQDLDLVATCNQHKTQLNAAGYTGDCDAIIKELGNAKYNEVLASIDGRSRQDLDLVATCNQHKTSLNAAGYTGDCDAIIKELGNAKYNEVLASIDGRSRQDLDLVATCN